MKNHVRILIAVALTFALAGPMSMAASLAQTPAQNAPQALAGTVTGTVKDAGGAPIAGVQISLNGPSALSAVTDSQGTFTVSSVPPGIYSFAARKSGYNTATDATVVVSAGQTQTLSVVMSALTFSSLRTIASVRAAGRSNFNTTPASVSVVSSQTFLDQAQPQVMKVLSETPGIVASLPQTSANGASPGAITFPNIRGALSFETASLIDGHPISVGSFGDYVTTFLNPFMLQDVEVVKGPGADAPEVNYAIGGTVNFVTKNPTFEPSGMLQFGTDNWGSTIENVGFSGTDGRWGYVVAYGTENLLSNLSGTNVYVSPQTPQQGIIGFDSGSHTGTSVGFNDAFPTPTVPGTISTNENIYNLVACCQTIQGAIFANDSELFKLRYKMSSATTATFTYFGGQTWTNQTANTGDITHSTFTLTGSGATSGQIAGYSGSIPDNSPVNVGFVRTPEYEINNEPIIQGDVRTTYGNDTILARYYAAGIHRLLYQGSQNPDIPTVEDLQLYGYDSATKTVYNGQSVPITFFDSFHQSEDDVLTGYSLEWAHPFSEKTLLTASYDLTNSTTVSYSQGANSVSTGHTYTAGSPYLEGYGTPSVTLPKGSGQIFSTLQVRGNFRPSSKLSIELTNYFNTYKSTVPVQCLALTISHGYCNPDGTGTIGPSYAPVGPAPGYVFGTTTTTHYDPRLSLEFRPNSQTAVRFAAGSSIAPPYLAELTTVPTPISVAQAYAVQQLPSNSLAPETAFGYDLGADFRFRDSVTTLSGDVYETNLYNHFLTELIPSGTNCPAIDPNTGFATPSGCTAFPLYYKLNTNLANAKFEGIELALRRAPLQGFGYTIQASTEKGYAYNLPPCFYGLVKVNGVAQCGYATNLAIVPNLNFTGGGLGVNGLSNQNLPYSNGYAELNWRSHGWYANVNEWWEGKNNSLDEPGFMVLGATVRAPLAEGLTLEVSGDNLNNQYPYLWPSYGAGVPIPLASGTLAATQANVLQARTFRFILTKSFGTASQTNP